MKFIKLTSIKLDNPVFINPEHIGHMYRVKEKTEYSRVEKVEHTRLGVTTHNNGGFEIKETPEQIMKLIIKFLKRNEHGVHSVKINNNGKEEIIYYRDFIAID